MTWSIAMIFFLAHNIKLGPLAGVRGVGCGGGNLVPCRM